MYGQGRKIFMKCLKCDGELSLTNVDGKNYAKCNKCGSLFTAAEIRNYAHIVSEIKSSEKSSGTGMMIWKLASGILSTVLFIFVALQSCAAGLGNALSSNGEISGTTGLIVAIMLLVGGIVSIVSRKGSISGNIAIMILYGIAALVGFACAGSYSDLYIWSGWCLICVILAVISLVIG